jgi:secreted PhoX family phosphatase
MAKDFSTMEDSNRSGNPSLESLSDPARRVLIGGGLGAIASALFLPLSGCTTSPGTPPLLGFKSVPTSEADTVVVPEGYVAQVIAPWGEPVGIAGRMPAWRPGATNSADEQAVQVGMHHDGIHFFPLGAPGQASDHGLLVMNHEYTDDGLLHADGIVPWTAEKVKKSQAAHGMSVIEVRLVGNAWQIVLPSRFARRITANTPVALSGPVTGHPLMRTAADPEGRTVRGTLNNCAAGRTPWGTYLAGEENFNFYFDGGATIDADQRRWGLQTKGWMRWAEHDERFDASRHPNEFHRFGWIVELDPMDADSPPVKRTALGRAVHEGAWVAVTKDGRAVVYSGEDARFEYLYKFVSRDAIHEANGGLTKAQANRSLLDHGTLYVARFDADGGGRWLPLVHGQGALTAANGFDDQATVLVKTRQASDLLGATKMDRPEWLAIDPLRGEVFCTLTNNSARGMPGQPAIDAVHPRAQNTMGQIVRWKETNDFDAMRFQWKHLLLAGDPAQPRAEARGDITGDVFACPDGLAFDTRGVLWMQTDAPASQMRRGEMARMGNNQMLACDPTTGEVRRFITGPVNCEVTGATFTPDGRTMFVNIQHPGESPSDVSDPMEPMKFSSWPEGRDRPRSATLAIRRHDGAIVGS